MLAEYLGIECSKRCELLLALAFLQDGERIVPLAHRLASDKHQTAVKLARSMLQLPTAQACRLAELTLAQAEVQFPMSRRCQAAQCRTADAGGAGGESEAAWLQSAGGSGSGQK